MEETRFHQKPWFYIVSRAVLMLALYGAAIFEQWQNARIEGEVFDPLIILGDIVLLILLLVFWLAFFAQFVLPVQTFEERQKIFDRLVGHLSGAHGPAIFVKNGQAVDRPDESQRKGAGVLWLDSASAVVTHVNVSFKHTFGPGVHFTDGGEQIAATVSLHPQSQTIGPNEKDDPFKAKGEGASEDEFKETQKRRMMTSALTRDGIEVVPNISVSFKIDADPVKGDRPGSHFGYSEEAVTRAIIGRAVNPNARPDTLDYNVEWNELPAYVAADLWREFMSKFKLMQLFETNCVMPAAIPQENPLPPAEDTEALQRPMTDKAQGALAHALTDMLHELNRGLEKLIHWCEAGGQKKTDPAAAETKGRPGGGGSPPDTSRKTALQVINFMLKERMTNPRSPVLDQNGAPQAGWRESREYRLLKERGIRITSVNVNSLRFPPKVEEQLVSRWTASWLDNARKERDRIELARSYASLGGQEKAMLDYTADMAYSLLESKRESRSLKETVKSLLGRSRMLLVRSDRMHRRAANELQELEDILQWLESNQT
ncbi:MAG: hypothetical protein ACOY0R_22160 [Chloroflexota bacterium]